MRKRVYLHLLLMTLIPFILVLAPLILGQWYGINQSNLVSDLQRIPVGSITGASFALLAFLLAFTFQIASSRFEARKKLFLDEVTNIRTTYLRAELMPEQFCTETKKLIVEYINLRVSLITDLSRLDYSISHSGQILDTLWHETAKLTKTNLIPPFFPLFAQSLNNLIDNYNQRITMTLEYRIPKIVFWALFFVTFFCMLSLGFQFGIAGKGHIIIFLLLALIISTVILLILALDNPKFSRLNPKPLLALQNQLK